MEFQTVLSELQKTVKRLCTIKEVEVEIDSRSQCATCTESTAQGQKPQTLPLAHPARGEANRDDSHFETDDANGYHKTGIRSQARKTAPEVVNKGTIGKSASMGAKLKHQCTIARRPSKKFYRHGCT